jgi:hypothetical protein
MAAPAKGIACRPPVGRTLSENFAVIAHRKHTFAVRNGVKFRGIFLMFGCQTLFSRQTFHGEVANLWVNGAFLGDDRPSGGVGMVLCGPFVNPCGALRETACGLLQAQRQTFHGEVANLPGKAHDER